MDEGLTRQGATAVNQAKEIFDYIKEHPGASIQEIVKETGWSRYVVEVATQALAQNGLISEIGRTEWGDPKYEYKVV